MGLLIYENKKFLFDDSNLEQFYIKNGFVVVKNAIEKRFLKKFLMIFLIRYLNLKTNQINQKKIDYHDVSILLWINLRIHKIMMI